MPLIALLACADGGLTWAESWEVFVLADDGALVDLTLMHGNSGLWAGGGKVRGAVAAKDEGAVLFGVDGMPDDVRVLDRGLAVGSDQLSETGGVWTASLHEGNFVDGYRDLRMTVGEGHGRAGLLELGRWNVEVAEAFGKAQGYHRVGQRDRLIEGKAVVLHRWGEQPPSLRGATRMTVMVLDEGVSVGVEQIGSQLLAWAVIDGEALPTDDARLAIGEDSQVQLDFRPTLDLALQIEPRRPRVKTEPYGHLTGPEQQALDLWVGLPSRRISRGSAIGVFEGRALDAPALMLWTDPEAEDPLDAPEGAGAAPGR